MGRHEQFKFNNYNITKMVCTPMCINQSTLTKLKAT